MAPAARTRRQRPAAAWNAASIPAATGRPDRAKRPPSPTRRRRGLPPGRPGQPLLRTLAPRALRGLERGLLPWLDSPHRFPLRPCARADLEGLATDLRRQAEALDVDRPLLVVMLMGGTGVGKSTLLNALAGGADRPGVVHPADHARPGRLLPRSVKPDRLDPALRHCRLVPHDRPDLEQKILVDTPDLDSNDLANREKLIAPAAGRRRRALRRLAGEVPRPARLGPVQGATAAAGVRVRAEQVGPLPARRRERACGPTRICSAT